MFCPKCKSEFEPGYTECAECEAALVDELPSEAGPEYQELVTVLVAPDENVLMVAKSRLEAEGIPCFTRNDLQDLFSLGRIAGYNILLGPQELQVPAEEVERAIEILEEAVVQEEGEDGMADTEPEPAEAMAVQAEEGDGETEATDAPPPDEYEYRDLKTVFVAPNESVLMAARSCLEAAGIPCFTTNNLSEIAGAGRLAGYDLALGPQELQVPAEDFEQAMEILESVSG